VDGDRDGDECGEIDHRRASERTGVY